MPLRVYAVIPRTNKQSQVHGPRSRVHGPRSQAGIPHPDVIERLQGLEREPLRVVRCGKLALIVGEARAAIQPDAGHLVRYDRILRSLAAATVAILPARFGVLVGDEARLRALVVNRSAEFLEALRLVSGREQMTLRVRFPAGAMENLLSRRRSPQHERVTGARYLSLRAALLRSPSSPEVRLLETRLSGLVRAERVPQRREPDMAVLYHLIDRGTARAYLSAIREVARVLPGVHLSPSGPFPPYAFVPIAWR